ncbi:MAG: hypothetical protein JWN95_3168 [Frankiales bacterium]|nr:hypothetical protein [Frankiales bacterium]
MPNVIDPAVVNELSPPSTGLSRWWLDRSVLVKGLTMLAIPMLAFIVVTSAGIALQSQERSVRSEARAASKLSASANAVLSDATDAETGVRGYFATGDAMFLTPYTRAVERQTTRDAALRAASVSPSEQDQTAVILATSAEEFTRLADLRDAIAAGASSTERSASVRAGKVVMDRLRSRVATLASDRTNVVTRKSAEIDRLERNIMVVEVSGLLFGVLAGLAGVALFGSGVSRRVRFAAGNASRLGEGAALLPTAPSNDELGRLGQSLFQAEALLTSRLQQVSSARDQAVLATQAKNTFMSRTSHELRTPLNAILGFAQLLTLSDLSQDDRDSAELILNAGQHLLTLINELIDTARVEAGDLRLSMEPVITADLVEEVANLLRPLAAVREITIELDQLDRTLAVVADKQRLRQVLMNLTSNAIKYNRVGGMITIGCVPIDEDEVAVRITDTGPGLTANEIERVFIPFERLQAEQHGIEGTGIGLPLALALTEAMRGVLQVNSVPGRGSTFSVRLQRTETPQASHGEKADAVMEATRAVGVQDLASATVLSIEDNAANALLLTRFFQTWQGVSLQSATSGTAGIESALRHRPDVILLDLHLPDLSGEEVFARLQAESVTASVPVIVLSADATPGTIRRLLARGVSAYLTKPVDLRELHELIAVRIHLPAVAGSLPAAPPTGGDTSDGAELTPR